MKRKIIIVMPNWTLAKNVLDQLEIRVFSGNPPQSHAICGHNADIAIVDESIPQEVIDVRVKPTLLSTNGKLIKVNWCGMCKPCSKCGKDTKNGSVLRVVPNELLCLDCYERYRRKGKEQKK